MSYVDRVRANLKAQTPQFTFIANTDKMQIKHTQIYVDGSYDTAKKIAGWGFVVRQDGKVVAKENGHVDDSPYGSRNITGEIMGAIMGLKWADKQGLDFVVIVHDYIGLGEWAAGNWKTKAPISIKYIELLKKIKCKAEFRHVKGHSGNVFNEMVDKEAANGKLGKKVKI